MTVAARRLPDNAEAQLHAAVINAALNRGAAAAQYLKTALALDPSLQQRDDVVALQQRLAAAKP
jgi:hypothetical protein